MIQWVTQPRALSNQRFPTPHVVQAAALVGHGAYAKDYEPSCCPIEKRNRTRLVQKGMDSGRVRV